MSKRFLCLFVAIFALLSAWSCQEAPSEAGAPAKTLLDDPERFGPQPTPRAALEKYLEILQKRIKDPNLGLFTPKSRKFFRQWLVTENQQRQEHAAVSAVLNRAEMITGEEMAVIRFPLAERTMPPYLLTRSEKGWMLDILAMSRLIGFNHFNEWHFRNHKHPWAFAFADWQFDSNGFPLSQDEH